MVEVW